MCFNIVVLLTETKTHLTGDRLYCIDRKISVVSGRAVHIKVTGTDQAALSFFDRQSIGEQ